MLGAQGLAGRADGIDRVALASPGPWRPLRPAHLGHLLIVLGEKGAEPGTVAAGTLYRPAATAGRLCLREVKERTVAARVAADLRTGQHRPDRAYGRGSEGVAVVTAPMTASADPARTLMLEIPSRAVTIDPARKNRRVAEL
ncbi:MAG: hypothetical protein ABSD40_23730 [Streptosporangiaceae bacterium]|jgi:hypothetical protein